MPKKHLGAVDKLIMGATAGAPVGSTGTELVHVTDVTVNYQRESVDVSDRASGEWGSTLAALKGCELSFRYWDTNATGEPDASLERLLSAWHSGDLVPMKAVSLAGRGIDADWAINNVEDGQPTAEGAYYQITANVNTDLRTPTELTAE